MLSYFDVIGLSYEELNQTTILILVQTGENKFSFRGFSAPSFNQLTSDPLSRATRYWLIDHALLPNNLQTERFSKLFAMDEQCDFQFTLQTNPLSREDIQYCLGIDPIVHIDPTPLTHGLRQMESVSFPKAREEADHNVVSVHRARVQQLIFLSGLNISWHEQIKDLMEQCPKTRAESEAKIEKIQSIMDKIIEGIHVVEVIWNELTEISQELVAIGNMRHQILQIRQETIHDLAALHRDLADANAPSFFLALATEALAPATEAADEAFNSLIETRNAASEVEGALKYIQSGRGYQKEILEMTRLVQNQALSQQRALLAIEPSIAIHPGVARPIMFGMPLTHMLESSHKKLNGLGDLGDVIYQEMDCLCKGMLSHSSYAWEGSEHKFFAMFTSIKTLLNNATEADLYDLLTHQDRSLLQTIIKPLRNQINGVSSDNNYVQNILREVDEYEQSLLCGFISSVG